MKWLLLILVICVAFAGFWVKRDTERRQQNDAEAAAYEAKRTRPTMAISNLAEEMLENVRQPINLAVPEDFAPGVQRMRDRVAEKAANAEAERKPVYDLGLDLLDYLVRYAQKRTDTILAIMKDKERAGSSLTAATMGNSDFHARSVLGKWDAMQPQILAQVQQRLVKLRVAEAAWNKSTTPESKVEFYDHTGSGPQRLTSSSAAANGLMSATPVPTPSTVSRVIRHTTTTDP